MKTLLLILSLFLVDNDRQEAFEYGVSSVAGNSVALHIGHQWFVDDDRDSDAVAAPGGQPDFPTAQPVRFIASSPPCPEPRQPLLADHPIRAPPAVPA